MVEHAVEDDADAALLARLEESLERVIATQQRVDLVVIVRMVAMVRGRLEDRVEVQRGDAQVDDVVDAFLDRVKITTLIAIGRRITVPRLEAGRLFEPIALGEPIGKDLVEDGVGDPGGRVDAARLDTEHRAIVGIGHEITCGCAAGCHALAAMTSRARLLALHRATGQPFDQEPLREEEDDEDRDRAQHRRGAEERP